MGSERVRIKDIADELGLSTATVSNVIHGKTRKISDETVKRVQALIEQKNYIPNMAGILLAQNDSRIIGVVVNDHPKYEGHVLEDGFISSSLNALSGKMNAMGYFMMVKTTTDWNDISRIASMWNMDGLILIGFCEQDYKKLRETMHIPFVVYDGFFPDAEKIVNVTIDHYDGGYQAGKYLRAMGHESVVCLSDNDTCMDGERIKGCAAGMRAEGETEKDAQSAVEMDTEYALKRNVGRADFLQIPMNARERRAFYDRHFAEICRYTAVFAVSDFYAVEFIRYAQEHGKRVPEDISVIGFDDNPCSVSAFPALTTIGQDAVLRAETALGILRKMKEGDYSRRRITLPVRLVERASVRNLNV